MQPPSQVTPSTQSSRPSEFSSSRSFTNSARSSSYRPSSIDAPTPRRDSATARRDVSSNRTRRGNDNNASSWDNETPMPDRGNDVDDKLKRPATDDSEFEREFYLAEDEGHYVQDQAGTEVDGDMGRFLFNNEKTRAREAEMEKKRQENPLSGRFSARKSALQDDQHAWEENRLLSSGAAVKGEVSLDIRTEDDARVTLLVHQVKPPFLDGRVSFSDIREAVPTVKDSSSDFAKMSREGSATLRHLRENKVRLA
jgi:pre-mRNA-splicing factor ATP-dependent RNA helicase DHX38/PRP16